MNEDPTHRAIWAYYGYDVDPNDIDPDGEEAAAIERIVGSLQSEREAAADAPTLHLRAVLYMLADLHPNYQCDAFQQALRFYNEAHPTVKIKPSSIDQDHLLSSGNLQTRIEAAAAEARRAGVFAFAEAILHGDEAHRKWLRDAATAFVDGRPGVSPPAPQEETR